MRRAGWAEPQPAAAAGSGHQALRLPEHERDRTEEPGPLAERASEDGDLAGRGDRRAPDGGAHRLAQQVAGLPGLHLLVYVTPQDCVPRWEVLRHGDVTIVAGGVRVAFGDWIVGDQDGLVIVPRERIDEILGEAEGKVATEHEIRESVRRGTLPLEAYERFGTL
jgi:hypothetical protein